MAESNINMCFKNNLAGKGGIFFKIWIYIFNQVTIFYKRKTNAQREQYRLLWK